MLSGFVISFLPRNKHLLISGLQSPSTVILEPKKTKSLTVSNVPPCICQELMGPDAMILVFWMLSFKTAFSLCSFTFIKRLFSSSLLSAIGVVSSAYLSLLIFLLAILGYQATPQSPKSTKTCWCGFPGGAVLNNMLANARDAGSVSGSERFSWSRKAQPTPVFLLGEVSWTEEPGRLQSMGSQRVGHHWVTGHSQNAPVDSASLKDTFPRLAASFDANRGVILSTLKPLNFTPIFKLWLLRHFWNRLEKSLKVKVKLLNRVRLFATPWTVA